MKKTFCDNCGKEFERITNDRTRNLSHCHHERFKYPLRITLKIDTDHDLCDPCLESIVSSCLVHPTEKRALNAKAQEEMMKGKLDFMCQDCGVIFQEVPLDSTDISQKYHDLQWSRNDVLYHHCRNGKWSPMKVVVFTKPNL